MAGLFGGTQNVVPTPRPDAPDFTAQFNTQIPHHLSGSYQAWLGTLPSGMDQTGKDYDLQGAYLAGLNTADNGHLPDTFKKPNHPTFSDQSKYSGQGLGIGGTWTQAGDGSWQFQLSPDQLNMTSAQALQNYFKTYEPDSRLIMPGLIGSQNN